MILMTLIIHSRLNRIVGDKRYEKNYIDIPKEVMEKLGWEKGTDLRWNITGNKLVLES